MINILSILCAMLLVVNVAFAQTVESDETTNTNEVVFELKELEDVDESNLPENVVVKYDVVDGVETPRYFEIVLREEFGNVDSHNEDGVKYFKWKEEYFLLDVMPEWEVLLEDGTADDYDIVYYEDNTRDLATEVFVNDSEEGGDVKANFKGLASKEKEAFVNNGVLGTVEADFVDNVRPEWSSGEDAIVVNNGTIDLLKGDFVSNSMTEHDNRARFGVLKNTGHIGRIEGDFIDNTTVHSGWVLGGGGTLYNGGIIDEIVGNFIGNNTETSTGGAIHNEGHIGRIEGDFIGNDTVGRWAHGGAIYGGDQNNYGSIDYIKGNFINNYVVGGEDSNTQGNGGAINRGNIGTIEGDFIRNKSVNGGGGAISWAFIDYIYGDFIENSASNAAGAIVFWGGWKNADGTVVVGDFIGNHAGTHGGAIVNEGNAVKSITGNFIGNYIKNTKSTVTDAANYQYQSWGGAISNDDCGGSGIALITGDFIGNYVESIESEVSGGAVANFYDAGGIIGTIKGNFENNYVYSETNVARGGAYAGRAEAKIDLLEGNFENNYAKSDKLEAYGGAIFNEDSEIGAIKGNFVGNYASGSSTTYGGAIYNGANAVIGSIEGDFENNTASRGGAIFNDSVIGDITGDFRNNGNAIYNTVNAEITSISGDFEGHSSRAISNYGKIGSIKGNFTGNKSSSAILNASGGVIDSIEANFSDNFALMAGWGDVYGGAIKNSGTINSIKGDFTNNLVKRFLWSDDTSDAAVYGGAIYNSGKIGTIDGNFSSNVVSGHGKMRGGAIYNSGEITLIKGEFRGNTVGINMGANIGDTAHGGAIYNIGVIGDIEADFIGNSASIYDYSQYGGAIYNENKINSIKGTFSGYSNVAIYNTASANIGLIDIIFSNAYTEWSRGSAIGNMGYIETVKGDFSDSVGTEVVYNEGSIGTIAADFHDNDGEDILLNKGEIGDIVGDFYDNGFEYGGIGSAIDNSGHIGSISGKFINNIIFEREDYAVVTNTGDIGDIEGEFDNNKGNVIYNTGTIDSIEGDFYKNEGVSVNNRGSISGISADFYENTDDVIVNSNSIGQINGSFVKNEGVAVENSGVINNITGDFIGNSIDSTATNINDMGGSAIYNETLSSIGVIRGSFINNSISTIANSDIYNKIGGGAIYNKGDLVVKDDNVDLQEYTEILGIEAIFENNYAIAPNGTVSGGAIYNSGGIYDFRFTLVSGNIGYIKGDFIGNFASALYNANGGAIFNGTQQAKIGDIEADFKKNYVEAGGAKGGAISNEYRASIGNITGNFVGNYALGVPYMVEMDGGEFEDAVTGANGGAIWNAYGIGDISGDFEGNYVSSPNGGATGGAISNVFDGWYTGDWGEIGNITGDFTGNYALANEGSALGGAVYNEGDLGSINANFTNNYVSAVNGEAKGGAILNIVNVNGDGFVTKGSIVDIEGDFEGNYALANEGSALGGAIYNTDAIGDISGDFEGNYVSASNGEAKGGAVFNGGSELTFVNSNFRDNYIISESETGQGAAIYSEGEINITADGKDSVFSGNYVQDINGKRNEAIYTSGMNVSAINGGNVVFDDSVVVTDGHINLNVMGDTTGEVVINSKLEAERSLLIADEGAIMHMGKEAEVWVEGFSSNDSDLVVDIAVDKENQSIQNGVIHVSGDVMGDTGVIVNSENPDGYVGAKTVYVEALNDDMETESNFRVDRVVGSPYMWASIRNLNGETEGSTWYLTLLDYEEGNDGGDVPPDDDDNNNNDDDDDDDSDDDGDGTGDNNDGGDDDGDESLVVTKPIYTPEVPAFISVPRVAIEQNRSIADSVGKGLAFEKNKNCSDNKCALNEAEVNKNVWVDVVYEKATIDAPHEIDAKIKGVTVGADVYRDANNRAGVFGAVRDGKYELSGEGDYYSNIGSEIETESYLGGVYYKHTNSNNWSAMAIAFIGKQEMDIATDDRIVNASTDALQFGVSTEVAKRFFISEHLDLEPSLGIFYTGIDIDNMSDNVGKTAKYDMLHYIEAELGLKLEYKFCNNGCTNRWYVKPSVIQTLASGGETRITGIREKIDTYDNELLGRFELGGEFGITSRLSGYTSFGYTFGDNYEAYDAKAGLNYEF